MPHRYGGRARLLPQRRRAALRAAELGGLTAPVSEFFDRAVAAQEGGRVDEAVALLERVLAGDADNIPALVNLGALRQAAGRSSDARILFERAIALDPNCWQAHNNLGLLHAAAGDEPRATLEFERAVAIEPGHAALRLNLAGALERAGRFEEALAQLNAIVACEPQNLLAQLGRIGLLFALERYAEGWEAYTWRYRPFWAKYGGQRPLPQPLWRGEPLAGKKILLSMDQGLGEQIMFASLVPEMTAAGARVAIECERRLVPLFARAFPEVQVIAWAQPWDPAVKAADIDFQTPIGDAGRWLRGDFKNVPTPRAYLKADPDRTARVRRRYEALANGRRIVGLSWHSTATLGAFKSIGLDSLNALLNDPRLFVVSLQYGVRSADVPGLFFDPECDPGADLDAAAAQIMACDGVITVSNTTAHLAGALGQPTFLMLSKVRGRHWYWFAERNPKPWYPRVRAFVQARDGDWSDVVPRVAAAIGELP